MNTEHAWKWVVKKCSQWFHKCSFSATNGADPILGKGNKGLNDPWDVLSNLRFRDELYVRSMFVFTKSGLIAFSGFPKGLMIK